MLHVIVARFDGVTEERREVHAMRFISASTEEGAELYLAMRKVAEAAADAKRAADATNEGGKAP